MCLCGSEFQDIFDIDHFITSLRDEVRILRELPPRLKRRVELGIYYSLPPVSWSDISYYVHQVHFYLRIYPKLLFLFLMRCLDIEFRFEPFIMH